MSWRIRPYRPGDFGAVYEICLLTGYLGEDASGLYDDPLLPGHLSAGPYVTLEPELAFMLEDDRGVAGYPSHLHIDLLPRARGSSLGSWAQPSGPGLSVRVGIAPCAFRP